MCLPAVLGTGEVGGSLLPSRLLWGSRPRSSVPLPITSHALISVQGHVGPVDSHYGDP